MGFTLPFCADFIFLFFCCCWWWSLCLAYIDITVEERKRSVLWGLRLFQTEADFRGGVPSMQKLPPPLPPAALLVVAQGYQRFPLSKPVVGQNMTLHAVPAYYTGLLIPTKLLPSRLIQLHVHPDFSNPLRWNVY